MVPGIGVLEGDWGALPPIAFPIYKTNRKVRNHANIDPSPLTATPTASVVQSICALSQVAHKT